ncbi:MAG: L-lactate dehydrogenase [Lachnospiraceae bacterium]|nr:L-lactate dehydrogenase [Lachnospiraceae bacterium]
MNNRKVAIIGCGFVGSATAFSLMQSGLFSEMVLLDMDQKKAEGEAMDIIHGMPFSTPMKIYAGDYDDIADSAIIIVTAGCNQKPDETRLDLVNKNIAIYRQIMGEIAKRNVEGILLIVSNPVDILTYAAWKFSGLPKNRVIGSGTVLDTARLKCMLGEELGVDARSVHAFIIGEHGDSELAVFSSANVSGIDLKDFYDMCQPDEYHEDTARIYDQVRDSAYKIIESKKATYFGVAMAVRRICECIMRNEHSILTVSSVVDGIYGAYDMALSLPCIIGNKGLEQTIQIDLDEEEEKRLKNSIQVLEDVLAGSI